MNFVVGVDVELRGVSLIDWFNKEEALQETSCD